MTQRALDIGCGIDKHPGAIGLDQNSSLEKIVDVIHKLTEGINLPFLDNSFGMVYMTSFLEHNQAVTWVLSEAHRVAKSGAMVEIKFPHYSCPNAHSDVTHIHHGFGLRAFDHFDPSTDFGSRYLYYRLHGRNFPFKIEELQPEFDDSIKGNLKQGLFRALGQDLYEKYVCRVFPLYDVVIRLRVIKP